MTGNEKEKIARTIARLIEILSYIQLVMTSRHDLDDDLIKFRSYFMEIVTIEFNERLEFPFFYPYSN